MIAESAQGIQFRIELQYRHPRFAQEAELSWLPVGFDQSNDLALIQSACPGDPPCLIERRSWADVWIEAAGRGSDEIHRNGLPVFQVRGLSAAMR